MAEVAAALGLGSSILTFIDIGYRVSKRLEELYSAGNEVPKAFKSIDDRLPLLLIKLREIKLICDSGSLDNEKEKAPARVVKDR